MKLVISLIMVAISLACIYAQYTNLSRKAKEWIAWLTLATMIVGFSVMHAKDIVRLVWK